MKSGVNYDDPAAWRGLRRQLATGKLSGEDALLVVHFAALDRDFLAHPDKIGLRPRYLFAPSRISELLPRARAKLRAPPPPPISAAPAPQQLEDQPPAPPIPEGETLLGVVPELSTLLDASQPWGRVQERWRGAAIGADRELGLRLRFVRHDPEENTVHLEAQNAAHVEWWCMSGTLLLDALAKAEYGSTARVAVRNRDRVVGEQRAAWRPR